MHRLYALRAASSRTRLPSRAQQAGEVALVVVGDQPLGDSALVRPLDEALGDGGTIVAAAVVGGEVGGEEPGAEAGCAAHLPASVLSPAVGVGRLRRVPGGHRLHPLAHGEVLRWADARVVATMEVAPPEAVLGRLEEQARYPHNKGPIRLTLSQLASWLSGGLLGAPLRAVAALLAPSTANAARPRG